MIVLVTDQPSGYRSVYTDINSIMQGPDYIEIYSADGASFRPIWPTKARVEILPDGTTTP